MPSGICDVCGKYQCCCSNVINSLFGHPLQAYVSPDLTWHMEEAYALVDEIEYEACRCNAEYTCGIHEKISELREVLRNKQSSRTN